MEARMKRKGLWFDPHPTPPQMARTLPEGLGAWTFRDIPLDLMAARKNGGFREGKIVKDFLIELA